MRGMTGWLCCALLLPVLAVAAAPAPMRYIHPPPESLLDNRYDFEWKILETALERTRQAWGDYRIEVSDFMTEQRQVHELTQASGRLSMIFRGTTPDMERSLQPVRIPVDLNLQGYCVLLIRAGEQSRFDAVRTLEDLKSLTVGLGLGWIDVDILRANGLNVVTGSSYEGLFDMLRQRRFDVLLRSSVEVLDEHAQRRGATPELAIEQRLLIYYPMPMYFWFRGDDEGRRLAARVETGMRAMLEDGSYQRIFAEYQDHKIRQLRLAERHIIRLRNPLLGSEAFNDSRLWFNPASYQPAAGAR